MVVRVDRWEEIADGLSDEELEPVDYWPEPMPLGGETERAMFPIEALPYWLAEMVHDVSVFTQTPVDLAGVLSLAVLATAAGGRSVVEARPGWREPTNLYAAVALPPGNRKSQTFAAMCRCLFAAEQTAVEATLPDILEAKHRRALADETAQRLLVEASRAKADDDKREEAAKAALDAESITVPTAPRLLADDVTPEALAALMARHGGRISVLSAEGGVFDLMAGRYSRSGPNLDAYLKGHSGDALRVDRQSAQPLLIDHACLTIGITVQPGVLKAAGDVRQFQVRGLLARFLFCVPTSKVGHRQIRPPAPGDDVVDKYERTVQTCVTSLAEWQDPAVLVLDAEAQDVLCDFEACLEPRLAPDADLGAPMLVEWASKLVGAVVRLSGLLHLAEHLSSGWAQPVTARTVRAACLLGDYFLSHAQWVFGDLMGGDTTMDDARHVLAWAKRVGPTFSRSECQRAHRYRFPLVEDVDPVLEVLENRHWIRRATPPPTTKRGGRPPSPSFEVNPDLSTNNSYNTNNLPPGSSAGGFMGLLEFPVDTPNLEISDEPPW